MDSIARWTDTHAHLADDALGSRTAEILSLCGTAGVGRVLCVGVDAASSGHAVRIAMDSVSEQPGDSVHNRVAVWASAGMHPNYVHLEQPGDWDTIDSLLGHPNVCALGETGLDRYWDDCPFPLQQQSFARHWEASRETGLPVIVHSRDCDEEMLIALREEYRHGPLRGVMHSFCGSAEMARECVAMGLYISFSGMLTYKKNDLLRSIAAGIPLERLLVETDAPYLSPEPMRAHRPNLPSLVIHTGHVLAQCFQLSDARMAEITTENALRLFSRMR